MLGLLTVRLQGSATSVVRSRLVRDGKVFSFCSTDNVFRRFWGGVIKCYESGSIGPQIRVLTDHKPLSYLDSSFVRHNPHFTRWNIFRQAWDIVTEYRKKGRYHGNADALSRVEKY